MFVGTANLGFIIGIIAGLLGLVAGLLVIIGGAAGASGLAGFFLDAVGVYDLGVLALAFGIALVVSGFLMKKKDTAKTGGSIALVLGVLGMLVLPFQGNLFSILAIIAGVLGPSDK